MSNPIHTPREEARLIEAEALRRAFLDVKQDRRSFTDELSPAYRRDVLRALAKRYNRLLDDYGFDGLPLDETIEIGGI